MGLQKYLELPPFSEISKYVKSRDYSKDNIAISGSPRKHPYDSERVIFLIEPDDTKKTILYEFKIDNISHVENITDLVSDAGDVLPMVKVWIKKGSIGLRYEPFIVDEQLTFI